MVQWNNFMNHNLPLIQYLQQLNSESMFSANQKQLFWFGFQLSSPNYFKIKELLELDRKSVELIISIYACHVDSESTYSGSSPFKKIDCRMLEHKETFAHTCHCSVTSRIRYTTFGNVDFFLEDLKITSLNKILIYLVEQHSR